MKILARFLGFPCHCRFLGSEQPAGVFGKGQSVWGHQEEQGGVKQLIPALSSPALPLQDPRVHSTFSKSYRNLQKTAHTSQTRGPEVTTLKRNFCFYVRKTGRQRQGLKKMGVRSSQKMSRSVPVSAQVWPAPTVTAVPAMGLPGKFRFQNINPGELLPGFWLGSILPLFCFACSPNLYSGISPSIFLFQKCLFHFTF